MRLHHLEWGPPGGVPVLLIHGMQGCAELWREVGEGLAARGFRAVAYDLRGHGRSDRSDDYRMAAHVADAAGLLTQLGLAPVAVVGHSLGGTVAWELAAARPDLVSRLVIEDQHPDTNPDAWRGWQEWAEAWPRRFGSRDEGLAYLRAQGRTVAWWAPSLIPLPEGGWGWAFDFAGVVETIRELYLGDRWASFARVTQPSLVLRGGRSAHVSADVAERMGRVLRHSRGMTIPEADHWIHRDPVRYVGIIAPFLEAVSSTEEDFSQK